ncbi:16S rRNA (cytosine(1402)-N(4))-methyltransferase RsmH [bacterium]|nr:16S rRNA (cytosine(1402)-N(4))-methyltransferase RsmH [bacterium]
MVRIVRQTAPGGEQPRGRAVATVRYYGAHKPVMAADVMERLFIDPSGVYLDATAGAGGFVRRILESLKDDGRVIAMDRDEEAIRHLQVMFEDDDRVVVTRDNFSKLALNPEVTAYRPLTGILFDLGVSSHMLDDPTRGFSHRADAPLDMRMDTDGELTASDVVNGYDSHALERVFRDFGEEPRAGKLARAVVSARPIEGTAALAELLRTNVPWREEAKVIARVFQAVRIEVNRELDALEEALPAALEQLKVGGRMVVMSYHSLEDRRAKQFFRDMSRNCTCPPEVPMCMCGGENARIRLHDRKALQAHEDEVERNPRARSVRIRTAEKIR